MGIITKPEAVKIAILDTGIKLSQQHKYCYPEEQLIYKSWLQEGEKNDKMWGDDVGHGTHLATLLLSVAPHAIVHVARVFRAKKPDMKTELENVAKVQMNSDMN